MADIRPSNEILTSLSEHALHVATQAVKEDQKENFLLAKSCYLELFERIINLENDQRKKNMAMRKCQEYKQRVVELNLLSVNQSGTQGKETSQLENLMKKAQTILDQALIQDTQKNDQEALNLYTDAVDVYLKAIKETRDEALRVKLKAKVSGLLDRAENLKGLPTKSMSLLNVRSPNEEVPRSNSSTPDAKLTTAERDVIFKTSHVNGKIYLPWLEIDLNEQFTYDQPFTDPDGSVNLSDKQKENFGAWRRPSQIMRNPKMIAMISSSSIIQDIVTDCSFVASLCVSASYERKFRKQLITRCIYPQNKLGQPMYNPSGKYMIKLTCNGIPRKVFVDDLLPVSRTGTLMCTFSTNKDELWASIIEKAYMKLMGGYDFPGSNSGIDLHALTGWIPEHIFIRDSNFNPQSTWKRILDGQTYGDALITIATGTMTDAEADLVGLVPTHAYAVLDVKEVNGFCLLQVKNPWSHKRWTGSFSYLDESSWTPNLMELLDYDRQKAIRNDDGIFWIDFSSVSKYFDSIHMNWNPELFPCKYTLHASWPTMNDVDHDDFNLVHNPQYKLEIVNEKGEPSVVFILLSKHITVIAENRDYITLHVYNNTQGEKIYYRGKPWVQGVYVNSPHILARFNAPPGTTQYTIVVAQHQKTNSLDYTLKCYCLSPFTLSQVPQKYPIEKTLRSQWTSLTAGGNASNITYLNNPQYCLSISQANASHAINMKARLMLMLEGPKAYAIHVKLVWSRGKRVGSVSPNDVLVQSGDYRHGFCYCEIDDIRAGDYTIVASTYEPGLIGDFILRVSSNVNFTLVPIAAEGAGMFKKVVTGKWIDGVNAMGCPNFAEYHQNPSFRLAIKEMTIVKIRLQTPEITPTPTTNIKIFEKHPTRKLGREVATSGAYTDYIQGVCTEEVALPPRKDGYIMVFSTWDQGVTGNFIVYVYSDRQVEVSEDF
ncbi:hypothetical protein G9A89_014924 [Geosiphon pyriformis]|nr:hypothetical protein G9A89_014924 [Geosiphon pyriformis]